MIRHTMSVLILLVALVGCKKEPGATGAPSKYAGTEEGARQLLTEIRSGDAKAMTQALRPGSADYKAVFVEDAAAEAEAGYEKLWSDPRAVISADPANSELLLSKATSEELQQWSGAAASDFPGGYRRIAAKLKPGLVVYRWKYVKPGETSGMSYDGLIFVGERWLWFPKPWRVLASAGEGGGE